MATSSITHNFVIEGKERVERFANAIEASWNEVIPERTSAGRLVKDPEEEPVGRLVMDPEEAREILRRCAERRRANAAV